MSYWGTNNSWDNGAGSGRNALKDVTNSLTRATEDEGGWGKASKYDDNGAGYAQDAGGYGDDTGGCFVCGSEEHMKNECPDKPAGGCFRCGADDHMKADCPEPPKAMGGCFNCGEVGHSKADCTNERVARPFTGTCNLCQEEGHRASECPTAPPKVCKNCEESETEGHTAATCTNRRVIRRGPIKEGQAEEAWDAIMAATNPEWEIDEIKDALKAYTDACPEVTWAQLEEGFRNNDMKIWLIAIEKSVSVTFTVVDLQGNIDKKFVVTIRKSPQPGRPYEAAMWPSSPAENMVRLHDAGLVEPRHAIKCSRCGELGHTRKHCKDSRPPAVIQGSVLHCYNCDEDGHRYRDCPKPREDKNACRNCKQPGHQSRGCPEPRNLDIVECNKCNEMGHFSRDCPTGGGGGGCHNCDATGHQSRECPLPRDYSRVKCNTCGEMGHTVRRCPQASAGDDFGGISFAGGGGDVGSSSNSYDHSSRDVSSSATVPAKASSSGWAKVSKGDFVAESNVAVADDGTSTNSFESAPFKPAVSSASTGNNGDDVGWGISSFDNGPAKLFPEAKAGHVVDLLNSAARRDSANQLKTSISVDDPWGDDATVATPKATGIGRIASIDSSNSSGGQETLLQPLFYNDGKNRHIASTGNPSSASKAPLTSARIEKKNDEIPRAGGFGGGSSSPEKDDPVKPASTAPMGIQSTTPSYAYQPARGPVGSALRLKATATPFTSSIVFPSVEKVGPKPAAAPDVAPGGPVVGRIRSHSIVKPIMLPHMVTGSSATTINPKTAHDVAPGGVSRASSQSILQPLKPSVPPHMTASSNAKAGGPPHKVMPSHQPAMGHLERTPPGPHGLDVFFDGKASESAIVDEPTPTFPSALAPPEESW